MDESAQRLAQIRARLAAAGPFPWSYNTYSCVSAPSLFKAEEDAWDRAPDHCDFPRRSTCQSCIDVPLDCAPGVTRRKCAALDDLYELDATVCVVPAIAGDTATGRHAANAEFIANAADDIRWLLARLEDR